MSNGDRKIYAGPRLRLLRRNMGLTQSGMAQEMGVSASYLNLIERNQRPLTAQLLLKLAETYDVDLRSLSKSYDSRVFADLIEVFSDPLMRPFAVPKAELQEVANVSPASAEAIAALYSAFRKNRDQILSSSSGKDIAQAVIAHQGYRLPMDEVHDFLHDANNFFPLLDEAAESLSTKLGLEGAKAYPRLVNYLKSKHDIGVTIMPSEVMMGSLRRYDRHRKRVMISELLHAPGRRFQITYQIIAKEFSDLIDAEIANSPMLSEDGRQLARIALINYMAGALLMPYERFYNFVEKAAYDVEIAASRFGTSFEQVCHRLTTLQKPRQCGVPFYMIRVDNAGNISKRFTNAGFPISRFGGSCPLWNVHNTFQTPCKFRVQVVEMPDGERYLSVARTVTRAHTPWGEPPVQRAISIGCKLEFAHRLIYARGMDLASPVPTKIGVNCSLCERPDCPQRAHPPVSRQMIVDEGKRGVSSFEFTDGTMDD